MSVVGILGTWVVVAERESQVSIDPPEANLLQSKRVSVVFGQLTADYIIDCRMYDGIVLNIMEEILNQFLKGTFSLLSEPERIQIRNTLSTDISQQKEANETSLLIID